MKKLILTLPLLFLIGCADTEFAKLEDKDTDTYCTIEGSTISCPDGTTLTVPEVEDEISFIITPIAHNSCTQVSNGLFVESIQNSAIFDVYLDSSCSDRVNGELNEVCDNVETSYGNVGSLGTNKPGAGEVCSYDNLLIFGERQENQLLIKILEVL